jgi:hypothetical protein
MGTGVLLLWTNTESDIRKGGQFLDRLPPFSLSREKLWQGVRMSCSRYAVSSLKRNIQVYSNEAK